MRGVVSLALLASLGGCAAVATPPAAAGTRSGAEAPVPPPALGILGCVESPALKQYVAALEAHRRAASDAALLALGAQRDERPAAFADPSVSARVGETYEAGGQRFAVVGQLAPRFAPQPHVPLVKVGNSLRPLSERPRAHPVPIHVCGFNACSAAHGVRAPVRPVVVSLAPDESLGEPVSTSYDYWWANVSYNQRHKCPGDTPASPTVRAE